MDRGVGAAARLPESDRKNLAVQALARSETVSDLAARHGVSRKFVYLQTRKVRAALDDAFSPATPDDEVLFELAVTKAWLRQVIVGLTLICRSSYRGVVEFLRDLLDLPVSIGTVHHVLQSATRQAGVINRQQDLAVILAQLRCCASTSIHKRTTPENVRVPSSILEASTRLHQAPCVTRL